MQMSVLKLILLVFAFVLFLCAAFFDPAPRLGRLGLIALGLACWVLTQFFVTG